jgi:hypothetical protein
MRRESFLLCAGGRLEFVLRQAPGAPKNLGKLFENPLWKSFLKIFLMCDYPLPVNGLNFLNLPLLICEAQTLLPVTYWLPCVFD